jgi:hypothetical protein
MVIEIFYEDYREVDGVKIPFLTRRVAGSNSKSRPSKWLLRESYL